MHVSRRSLSESSLSLVKLDLWFKKLTFDCGSWIGDKKNWAVFWNFGVLILALWCWAHCSCLTARRFQVWLGLSILCLGGFSLGNLVSSHRPETCTLGWLEPLNCPLVWVCEGMVCVLQWTCPGCVAGCCPLAAGPDSCTLGNHD